jgi:hypothetical protein
LLEESKILFFLVENGLERLDFECGEMNNMLEIAETINSDFAYSESVAYVNLIMICRAIRHELGLMGWEELTWITESASQWRFSGRSTVARLGIKVFIML